MSEVMEQILKYRVQNDFSALSRFLEELRGLPGYARLNERQAYRLGLVLEEMISNIIKYGYDDSKVHEIEVVIRWGDMKITVELSDDGHPFDPMRHHCPGSNSAEPLEQRPIGGLGIHLARQMSEEMTYRRENGRNILQIQIGGGVAGD